MAQAQLDSKQAHDSHLLREVSAIVSGPLLTIWSTDGRKLVSIQRGEDRILEAFLGEGRAICWSSDSGQEYLEVHDDTNWIWVIRAAEGDTTSVRCYKDRPLPTPMLRCRRGHLLLKDFGPTGFFRRGSKHQCCRCSEVLRSGTIRWVCKICNWDHCFDCAEGETWAQAFSPAQVTDTGRVQRIEDFVMPGPTPNFGGESGPSLAFGGPSAARSPSEAEPEEPARRRIATDGSVNNDPVPKIRNKRELERASNLQSVPFLGVRPLGRVQTDTMLRFERLIAHGDMNGAWRTLTRARKLNVEEQDLQAPGVALALLEELGEFHLLRPEFEED